MRLSEARVNTVSTPDRGLSGGQGALRPLEDHEVAGGGAEPLLGQTLLEQRAGLAGPREQAPPPRRVLAMA